MFSGGANGRAVSKSWRKNGLRGSDYDLTDNQDHDVTQALGFGLVLLPVLGLAMSDPLWSGMVCTSVCWVSRSTSQRADHNHYLGTMSLKHVATGNLILYRNLLILIMHQTRGGITLLEQPLGSCMPQIKIVRSTWELQQWNYVVVWLGAYGAESKQPIKVFSSVPWIEKRINPLDNSRISDIVHDRRREAHRQGQSAQSITALPSKLE